jgi:hypothetical protein
MLFNEHTVAAKTPSQRAPHNKWVACYNVPDWWEGNRDKICAACDGDADVR